MTVGLRLAIPVLVVAAVASMPARVGAQAFTPPGGVGSVTLAWQWVDNTGHRLTDGFYVERGQSVSTSALGEVEYGVTDRLAASVGTPYVGAKYTGALPPPSGQAVDACQCWHSSFQDLAVSARYRFGSALWALTPFTRLDLPTHDYNYQGEAVVGKNLREFHVGLAGGLVFTELLPRMTVQATYAYTFVEQPLPDVPLDRSTGGVEVGYPLARRWYVRGTGAWQYTHGGLRAGSPTGNPFPFPGELNTPERRSQRDRLIKVKYWQVGGGVTYTAGPVDVFASYSKYVWGRDAHNGSVYNLGVTYYFDVGRGMAAFETRAAPPGVHNTGRLH